MVEKKKEGSEHHAFCCVEVGTTWNRYACGRPVKGALEDGTLACGLHIAGEKKRIASDKAWHEKCTSEKAYREETLKRISESIYRGSAIIDAANKTVKIPVDAFLELLERLRSANSNRAMEKENDDE